MATVSPVVIKTSALIGAWGRRELDDDIEEDYRRYCQDMLLLPAAIAAEVYMCCKYDLSRRAQVIVNTMSTLEWVEHFQLVSPDEDLFSPIIFALSKRSFSTALKLINASAPLGHDLVLMYPKNEEQHVVTALHLAVSSGRRDIVRAIMTLLNQTERNILISVQATMGQYLEITHHCNVLAISLACGYSDIYHDLIRFGGSVDFVDPYSSATAIHALIDYSKHSPDHAVEILEEFLSSNTLKSWWDGKDGGQFGKCAEADYNDAKRHLLSIRNRDGYAPLTYAALKNSSQIVQCLLQYEGLYRHPVSRIGKHTVDHYDLSQLDPIISREVHYGQPNVIEHLVHHSRASFNRIMLQHPIHELIKVKWLAIRPFFFLLALVHFSIMSSYTITEVMMPILNSETGSSDNADPAGGNAVSRESTDCAGEDAVSDRSFFSQDSAESLSSDSSPISTLLGFGWGSASISWSSYQSYSSYSGSSQSSSSWPFSSSSYSSSDMYGMYSEDSHELSEILPMSAENSNSETVVDLLVMVILVYFLIQLIDAMKMLGLFTRGRICRFCRLHYKVPWWVILKPDSFNFIALMFCVSMLAALYGVLYFYPPALILGWFYMLFFARAFPGTCYFTVMVNAILINDMLKFTIVMIFIMLGFGTSLSKYLFELQHDNADFEPQSFMNTMIFYLIGRGDASFSNLSLSTLVLVYFIIATVLMLNLLIAAMSDTYGKIRGEDRGAMIWQMRLKTILIIEERLPHKLVFWLLRRRLHYDAEKELWMLPVHDFAH